MLLKATQASVPRGHEIGFVLDATQQCADVADVSLACGSRWLQYPLPTAVADRLMQDPKLKGYIFPAPTPTLPYAGQQRQYNEVLMAEDVSIRTYRRHENCCCVGSRDICTALKQSDSWSICRGCKV